MKSGYCLQRHVLNRVIPQWNSSTEDTYFPLLLHKELSDPYDMLSHQEQPYISTTHTVTTTALVVAFPNLLGILEALPMLCIL